MKKRILACLLTLCMMIGMISALGFSAAAASSTYTMTAIYNGGEYTTELKTGDTVTISSAEELKYLSAYVAAGENTVFVTFRLTCDIVLNEGTFAADGTWSAANADTPTPVSFTPIGDPGFEGISFRGIFDGNGYSISGLYINTPSASFVGLFGNVGPTAVIRDLTVKNSYVAGSYFVGGIAGFSKSSAWTPVFNNCTFEGHVRASSKIAGGILGCSYGAEIINCTNNGTVDGIGSIYALGGILGMGAGQRIVNCVNNGSVGSDGQAAVGGIVGQLIGENAGEVSNCINYGEIAGYAKVDNAVGSNSATTSNVTYNAAATVADLNALAAASESNLNKYQTWIAVDGKPVLSGNTAIATVTAGDKTYATSTITEAGAIAAANQGSTLKIVRNGVDAGGEIGGTYGENASQPGAYTLDLNNKAITLNAPLTVSIGTVTVTNSTSYGGGLSAVGCSALVMKGGNLNINNGYIVSDTTFAVQNCGTGELALAGDPVIRGGAGIALYVGYANTLSGAVGDSAYAGSRLGVSCGWIVDEDQVLAKNASENQFYFHNYDTGRYCVGITEQNTFTAVKLALFSWIIVGVLAAIALALIIVVIAHTVGYKRKMKFLSVSFPVLIPILFMFTTPQMIGLITAGAVCLVAIVACAISIPAQNKKLAKAKAEKAAQEELAKKAPAQDETKDYEDEQAVTAAETVEETTEEVVEEATEEVTEEATEEVADEAAEEVVDVAAEEVTEEAAEEVAEETAEEVTEEAAEEVADETAEEVTEEAAEEVVEETAEEVANETAEEVANETAEEVTEEAAEEVVEEAAEEVANETAEEVTEEAAEEVAEEAAEEVVEETAEEVADETAEEAVTPAAPPKVRPDRLVVAETDANGNVIYSAYKKSFTARIIQSPDNVQERYETLKNALLSYKKVSSRVSWSYDSIKSGRKQLAKFAIRGKSLCLFLALDPATLEDSKYNIADAGKSKKYETVPCRLRLTSKRSIKWGLELIAILAEREGLEPNPKFKPKEWRMENETTESLIEKGLIKKVL